MIKKMRQKVILVAIGAMLTILLVLLITVNWFMSDVSRNQVDGFLMNTLEHGGRVNPPREPDDAFRMDNGLRMEEGLIEGITLRVDSEYTIIDFLHQGKLTIDNIELLVGQMDYSEEMIIKSIDDYRYGVKKTGDNYIVAIADTSVQNVMLQQLLGISSIMGLISFFLSLVFVVILARYITRPVEVAFEKQKRFISDSSHELKTPLSILSANLDMLEMENGESKRTQSMGESIGRMNTLIHELLLLARTEEKPQAFFPFSLSEVMESTILPLEVIAYEQGNTIETYIEDDIVLKGDEESVRKMIGALMENAIKYSRENTVIKASLYKRGDNKIIEIYNEGVGVTKEQKEKLFDKFYRVDDSRNSQTGGHGIGLSIVKNVVDMHKGKIQVQSIPNVNIIFKITLK